jgi:hypothetical protein
MTTENKHKKNRTATLVRPTKGFKSLSPRRKTSNFHYTSLFTTRQGFYLRKIYKIIGWAATAGRKKSFIFLGEGDNEKFCGYG